MLALCLNDNKSNTQKTWINNMEWSWNSVWIWTKLPSICDVKLDGISTRIHGTVFTGLTRKSFLKNVIFVILFSSQMYCKKHVSGPSSVWGGEHPGFLWRELNKLHTHQSLRLTQNTKCMPVKLY